jgi:FkbM family methyltransferase
MRSFLRSLLNLADVRERAIHIEDKVDGLSSLLDDVRQRTAGIENNVTDLNSVLADTRQRSIDVESKIGALDSVLVDMRQRVINTEVKLDQLARSKSDSTGQAYAGHPDQRYGHLTYSQHGEDLVFASLFEQLGIKRASYLDIGAHHPLHCSNTALLYNGGSRGVNVDANPDVMPEFHRLRPSDININVGVGPEPGVMTFYRIDALSGRNTFSREAALRFVGDHPQFNISDELQIPVVTLNQLVDQYCEGQFPHLLSLDAEGLDYAILESTSFATSSPAVICVETYSAAGQRSGDIIRLLELRTFVPYVRMGENVLFLRRELGERLTR